MNSSSHQKWHESVQEARDLYEAELDRLAQMPEVLALSGRRICIAGCTGLIGSALLSILMRANRHYLQQKPIEIIGLARHSSPQLPINEPHFRWLEGAVNDDAVLSEVSQWDYIVYMAGATSDYLQRRTQIIETQMTGLENWLMRAQNVAGFLFISSTRVYGRQTGDEFIDEERVAQVTPMHLDNIYDAHKFFGESLCLWHSKFRQVPSIVARISNVYGPTTHIRSETAVTNWIRQALDSRRIVLTGPDSIRNYCSVLDMAQGLLKALTRGQSGRAYNLGSRENCTARHMAQTLAAACPMPVKVEDAADALDASIVKMSIARAQSELGFEPRFRVRDLAPLVVAQTALGLGRDLSRIDLK